MGKFTYEIATPQGTFQVESDKELSDAEAYKHVEGEILATQQRSADQLAKDRELYAPDKGMSAADKFVIGAGAAVDRTLRGVKGLFGTKDEQGAEDAELYQRYHPGGWATAGEIGQDVLMSAVPVGGASVAGAKVLGRVLPQALARFAPAAADIAANAGYAAATNPEDRGRAAALGGAGAAAGRVLTRALSGAVRPSAEAQAMLDKGVRLTPGQAGEGMGGTLARTYEGALEAVPVVGQPVRMAKDQALKDWNRYMVQKAGAEGVLPTPIPTAGPVGREGVDKALEAVKARYDSLLPEGQTLRMSTEQADQYAVLVNDLTNNLPPSARAKFAEVAEWIGRQTQEGVKASHWKEVIEGELDGAIKAAKRDGQHSLGNALKRLDAEVNSSLPIPMQLEKRELDAAYRNLNTLKDAAGKAAPLRREGGAMYPSEVAQSAAKRGDKPTLERALAAQQIFGNAPGLTSQIRDVARAGVVGTVGHTVAGGAAIPPALVSLLGATEVGRRLLLGQTTWQQFVKQQPKVAEVVTRYMTQFGRSSATATQSMAPSAVEPPP